MSRAARARAVLLTLASCSAASTARAEPADDATPFRLSYEAAPEGCPNAPAFFGAIRARTERARLAAPGESSVAIAVRIAGSPRGAIVGRVEIREPDGAHQERVVQSATCKEVAQALALVIALYLDPDATSTPEPEPEPEPVKPAPGPLPTPSPARPPRKPPPRKPPPAPPVTFGAGVGAGLVGGVGPSMAPFGRALGEVTIDGEAIARVMAWARPSARLSIDLATTTGDVAAGSQRYLLLAGSVRLCPVDVALVRGIHAGPCGGLQAGMHRGTSEGVPNARAQEKVWMSPLATIHSSFAVARDVSLDLDGGIALPLVRTRFFLGPDVTLFRTPAVAGTLSAAVTVWFR